VDELFKSNRDLVYFSRKTAEIKTKIDLKEHVNESNPLNYQFSERMKEGVRAVAVSPDFNQFVLLNGQFEVFVLDKKRDQISKIKGLGKNMFLETKLNVNPFDHNLEAEAAELNLKDAFKLWINNEASIMVLYCKLKNQTWVWQRSNEDSSGMLSSFKN
jgi:hypothetical protein